MTVCLVNCQLSTVNCSIKVMPRSGKIKKKLPNPDVIYKNRMVTKLIHKVMLSGRKSVAEKIVYDAFDKIKEQEKQEPLNVYNEALKNLYPKVEVRARRVGGASYQVPVEVRGVRKEALAVRWLVDAARARSNKDFGTMMEKLAAEIIDSAKNQGEAIKKKDVMHKMAEANKAFAHFKW